MICLIVCCDLVDFVLWFFLVTFGCLCLGCCVFGVVFSLGLLVVSLFVVRNLALVVVGLFWVCWLVGWFCGWLVLDGLGVLIGCNLLGGVYLITVLFDCVAGLLWLVCVFALGVWWLVLVIICWLRCFVVLALLFVVVNLIVLLVFVALGFPGLCLFGLLVCSCLCWWFGGFGFG